MIDRLTPCEPPAGGHRLHLAAYFRAHIFQAGKSFRGWDTFLVDLPINRSVAERWVDCLAVAADGCLPAPLLHDNPPDGRRHFTQG